MMFREDLDCLACSDPSCDHTACDGPVVFHGRCHPASATWCEYYDGSVKIRCAECNRFIVEVMVASQALSNYLSKGQLQ